MIDGDWYVTVLPDGRVWRCAKWCLMKTKGKCPISGKLVIPEYQDM